MRTDLRFEDDRAERRSRAGVATGLFTGASLGLVVGALLPGGVLAAVIGTVLGAALGAFAGRSLASHIMVDDWEPSPGERPFVGAHAPDDDTTDGPAGAPAKP